MKNKSFPKKILTSDLLIGVTSSSFSKSDFLRAELKNFFPNVIFNELGRPLCELEIVDLLKNCDASIVGLECINDRILVQTPKLKIICKYGVGLDNIDQGLLKRRNIFLGWSGGVNRLSVAEVTLCFMLGLSRNIFASGFKLKNAEWKKNGGCQLTGKTVGIIGCGHIGSEVIRLLKPFQCKLLVHDIIDKSKFCKDFNATETNLKDLITCSDLISLHVPLTTLTQKMVDASFLSQMKQSAYLINTGRGGALDQGALKNTLMKNEIAGAALDVFTEEPPSDKEFLSLPNLMVTPHIAGNAKESIEAMGKAAINHLVSFFMNSKA
jgi:phosphoglycerate dehydrogenase-like enzyme